MAERESRRLSRSPLRLPAPPPQDAPAAEAASRAAKARPKRKIAKAKAKRSSDRRASPLEASDVHGGTSEDLDVSEEVYEGGSSSQNPRLHARTLDIMTPQPSADAGIQSTAQAATGRDHAAAARQSTWSRRSSSLPRVARDPSPEVQNWSRRNIATWSSGHLAKELEDQNAADAESTQTLLFVDSKTPSQNTQHASRLHKQQSEQIGSKGSLGALIGVARNGSSIKGRTSSTREGALASQRRAARTLSMQTLDFDVDSSDGSSRSSECAPLRAQGQEHEGDRVTALPPLPHRSCLRSSTRSGRYAGRPRSLPLPLADSSQDGATGTFHRASGLCISTPVNPMGRDSAATPHKATAVSFANVSTQASSRTATVRTDAPPATIRTTATHWTQATAITAQTYFTRDTTATTKTVFTRMTTLSEFLHAMPFGLPLLTIARPVFILTQILVALGLWFVTAGADFDQKAGLDALWDFKGQTDLRWGTNCKDHRPEVWRLFTYQFTHLGILHVVSNSAMLLICIPLERFHGTLHILAIFNAGVVCGAGAYYILDAHRNVVGMSGGNFALFGMYIADLAVNWSRKEYKKLEMCVFAVFAALLLFEAGAFDGLMPEGSEVAADSKAAHSVHLGGFVGGVLATAGIGRLAKRHRTRAEKVIQVVCLLAAIVLAAVGIAWGQQWPPRNALDSYPWCWTRMAQVGRAWQCVHCEDQACIDEWLNAGDVRSATPACYASVFR